jgi:hypothetical protein
MGDERLYESAAPLLEEVSESAPYTPPPLTEEQERIISRNRKLAKQYFPEFVDTIIEFYNADLIGGWRDVKVTLNNPDE